MLRASLGALAGDFRESANSPKRFIKFEFIPDPWKLRGDLNGDLDRYWIVTVIVGSSRSKVSVDLQSPQGFWQYFIAEVLQAEVAEEKHDSRPRCLDHRHSLSPDLNGVDGVWLCSLDGEIRCLLGSYWEYVKHSST